MSWNRKTILSAAILLLGAQTAQADKADDTLRIAWGVDGVMVNADNYYGATRAGLWFTAMVWDTLVYRDPNSAVPAGSRVPGRSDAGLSERVLRRGRHRGHVQQADRHRALQGRQHEARRGVPVGAQ